MDNHTFTPIEARKPPSSAIGPIAWMKESLFSSPVNTLLTVFFGYIIIKYVPPILDWAFFSANWVGTTQDECTKAGACWIFIKQWFNQLLYGSYPESLHWRVNLALIGLVAVVVLQFFLPQHLRRRVGWVSLLVYPLISLWLMYGGFGLETVSTDKWGGFSLNILLAFAGILMSLPIGIVWALGRQSNMPFVKMVCIASIELFRGVPLITILFMGSVMLPLFFPAGVQLDKLMRAFIAITLFQSAYMAEVVRGGLQAIPKGQVEAANSLGLGYWKTMRLIVLPQALKISIPNIVNTFISLFKDTTLVLIIGLFEVLSTIQAALQNSSWLGGHEIEGYVFVAFVFWVFCYIMSRISVHIEKKLDTGHSRS